MKENVNRPSWRAGVLVIVALAAIGWGLARSDEFAPVETPPFVRSGQSIRQVLDEAVEARRRIQERFAR